jgi:phosphate:Na+ symporter
MNQTMENLFGLLGGLAIFIYGMHLMSECLQKAAGEKMKDILSFLTKNPVTGVLAGTIATAVLQSSSATTVMAIGFVSAGLMNLPQAISIIMGANIGTTITAQIIAFKISDYIYVFLFAGFLLSFLARSMQLKNIGRTIFAFGLLFLGIETMGGVMKPLASSPVFTEWMGRVSHIPLLGILLGTIMTLLVQSSSATIAVLQNFASQPGADGITSVIGLSGAIPILLGNNIGTTVTAFLAAVGQTKDAKRTALAHCIFNLSGAFLFVWFVTPYARLIQAVSPKGPEVEVIARQIANAHTGFNLIMTLLWVPLIGILVKIVVSLIRDRSKEMQQEEFHLLEFEEKLVGQPVAALRLMEGEIFQFRCRVGDMLQHLCNAVSAHSSGEKKRDLWEGMVLEVQDLQSMYRELSQAFLLLLSAGTLSEYQANDVTVRLKMLEDEDRLVLLGEEFISVMLEQKLCSAKHGMTSEAVGDLTKSLYMLWEMYHGFLELVEQGVREPMEETMKKREKMLKMVIKLRRHHEKRLNSGKCRKKWKLPYHQLVQCVDRMSNCCSNLMDAYGILLVEE